MSKQPLAEVFGFPIDNMSAQASRHRKNKLCPHNNRVPNCTKDKANDPLGVCSIHYGKDVVITCPIRFRQEWLIADDAARFFFSEDASWTSLTEVRLKDAHGQSAGNIDVVLVAYDNQGQILDFGALEVQAVYISGNVRRSFEHYKENNARGRNNDWECLNCPDNVPDLKAPVNSLVQFLQNAGMVFNSWGKKIAIAIHQSIYSTLPPLPKVERHHANLGLMLYDLHYNGELFNLQMERIVYTRVQSALEVFKHKVEPMYEIPSLPTSNIPSEKAFRSLIDEELKRIAISEQPFWDLRF